MVGLHANLNWISGRAFLCFLNMAMKYSFFTLFLLYTVTALSQQMATYKAKVEGFSYLEHETGNGGKALPLLIAFHYSSGTPIETMRDYDSLKAPVRIIVPKGNYRKRGGFSYYPVNYYQTDSAAQFATARATLDSIANFVRVIEKKYGKKAIVSGISQGGDIALLMALYYPERCAASFPIAAVINPALVDSISNASNIPPIFLHQGEADKIVSIDYTRKKVSQLQKRIILKLYSYPGVGHEISPEMKDNYSAQIDELIKK